MADRQWVWVAVVVMTVVFFGQAYLMIARPTLWAEWVFSRPMRWYGLTVSIGDEQKLHRVASRLGWTYVLLGVVAILLVLGAAYGCLPEWLGIGSCRG